MLHGILSDNLRREKKTICIGANIENKGERERLTEQRKRTRCVPSTCADLGKLERIARRYSTFTAISIGKHTPQIV